ncbi:MAG: Uma2 family endonuclease [Desulfobacterales bacterium]|nr:Uma2 family endonuclease [Desulfobacterales bacterium]
MAELAFNRIDTQHETINYDDVITEDDTPVDNIFSEKQQRLLVDPLINSWRTDRPFIACSNVGIFFNINEPPLVPDMFLSMDVHFPENIWEKRHRSYFFSEFGKPPEVVVEVVSNLKGEETDFKLNKYAQIGVLYYVVFDPQSLLHEYSLRVYELKHGNYLVNIGHFFPDLNLGLTLWKGEYEGRTEEWLRWCDTKRKIIPTGFEMAERERHNAAIEKQRADMERIKAEKEKERADMEKQRADRLAEKLKSLGISFD